jgi:hypothetical protein
MHESKSIMYFISVENQHIFLASQGKYLTHNGALGATIGCYLGASTIVLAYTGVSGLLTVITGPAAPAIMPLWYHFTAVPLGVAITVGTISGGIIGGIIK